MNLCRHSGACRNDGLTSIPKTKQATDRWDQWPGEFQKMLFNYRFNMTPTGAQQTRSQSACATDLLMHSDE